jgi:hypothetical protein
MPDSDTSVGRVDITLRLLNWVKTSRLRSDDGQARKRWQQGYQ